MNKYVIVFYNRFVNEIQTYKVKADNEEEKLELNNDEFQRILAKWYFAWNMEGNSSKEDTVLSNKIREHLKSEGVLQTT